MTPLKNSVEYAEAKFAATQWKAEEARIALNDYAAEAKATDEKTARLRLQRLAKEAAEMRPPKARSKPSIRRRKIREQGPGYRLRSNSLAQEL